MSDSKNIRTILAEYTKKQGIKKIQLAKKTSGAGWITSWPPKQKFYEEITKETELCNNPAESLILDFCAT